MAREPGDPKVDFELLLEHRSFVRGLARSLVRDEARAEDVEQETWVAALRRPPRHAGALRAWLASVVKKLAWTANRGEARRARRERIHGGHRPEAETPPEVMERALWSQRVVAAVMDLEEPYRSTVLLRFFEGLQSSEIARLQQVPAATVRTRLRRALAQLRERFDGEVEGGRAVWVLALAPLAHPPPIPAGPSPGARRVPWKVAAAGVALSLVTLIALSRSVFFEAEEQPRTGRSGPGVAEPEARTGNEPLVAPRDQHALEVVVLAAGRPAPGARVALTAREPHPWRHTPFDRWALVAERRADARGVARFAGLDEGDVRAFAVARGFARGSAVMHLPNAFGESVVIELAPEDPWEVRVTDLETGRPVAGATIRLRASPVGPCLPAPDRIVTDEEGVAAIAGVRAGRPLRIRVDARDHLAHGFVPVETTEPWSVGLERCDRTVRWPVRASPFAPAEGTALHLRRVHEQDGAPGAVCRAGEILAPALPRSEIPELLALAPDGSFTRLSAAAEVARGEPVTFRMPPRLALALRDTRGAPVAGAEIELHDRASGTRVHPGGVSDEAGRAEIPVYAADEVEIFVRAGAARRFRSVGSFDPGGGGGALEIELPVARRVVLRVEPRLPERFELYAGRERLREEALSIASDRKVIRFVVRRRGRVRLHLLARGFVAAGLELGPSAGETIEEGLFLDRAGELVLPVLLRDGRQPHRLELVAAGPEPSELWRGPWRFRLYPGPDGVVREAMIPPGGYRVRDGISGVATTVFRITPGGVVEDRFLDLSRPLDPAPELVRGWVEAYPELDLSRATVDFNSGSAEVARDGSFRFEWPGRCRVRVRHPDLDPERSPEIELAEPREDLLLKLTPWNRAFVRLDPAPGPAAAGGSSPRVRIDDGERTVTLGAVVDGAELRFAGHRAGRADLWIDVSGFEPARLAGVLLHEGTTDLGTLPLARGTRLELLVRQPEEVLAPRLMVAAQALDRPRYQRSVQTGGESRALLPGLGEGAFLLRAFERDTGRCVWSRRIEADGETARTIEIDLR